jgi:glycosyltransferase involved in cell wall biosynthesis
MESRRTIMILGCRGVPASHGGFETFAEQLSLFLVGRGWHVIVYCQKDNDTVRRPIQRITSDSWRGIERRHVSVTARGALATLEFDWHCVRDASRHPGLCLVLGYNGAVFLPYLRIRGGKIITNMDGVEWRRLKWNIVERAWLWLSEWIGAWVSHRLIADNPAIAEHLASRRNGSAITMIPYGGINPDSIARNGDEAVQKLGLESDRYLMLVARIEPDNNIQAIIEAFSRRRRNVRLIVLGTIDPTKPYHRSILQAANAEVIFLGANYDPQIVIPLRLHARAYLHGHMVGGTNPSLVEALWARNAIIAYDNPYNRWTAGDAGFYFTTVDECDAAISRVLTDDAAVARARIAAIQRAIKFFDLAEVLLTYERQALTMLGDDREISVGTSVKQA